MSIKRLTQIVGLLLGLILIAALVLRLLIPRFSPEPDAIGVVDGELSPCPDSPNCVSSFATDAEHAIDPLAFSTSAEEAQADLLAALSELPRATLVTSEPGYVHAIFRSPLMGYVDDGEFLFDEAANVIHVRMAARLGQADMGANRNRVEMIRERLQN